MKNIYIGIVCLVLSVFVFFFSTKEGPNALGYKSPQLNTHKSIWIWTNRCFGFLALIGSSIYLLLSIIFKINDVEHFIMLNQYGLLYIAFSFIITEIYAFIKKINNKKTK